MEFKRKEEKLTPEQEKERMSLLGPSTDTKSSKASPKEGESQQTRLISIDDNNNEIDKIIGKESFGADITTEKRDFSDLTSLIEKFSEDEKVKVALSQGVDMREYTKKVEKELKEIEEAAVADYLQEGDNFAELYLQIKSCDQVLERMETLLGGFQRDLGLISTDIHQLQEKSNSMSYKLKNRQSVSKELSLFLQYAFIPEGIIKAVCEEEVTEAYIEYLLELNRRILFVESKTKDPAHKVKACADLLPDIEKMKYVATSKIRQFLLQMISSLKKPRSNIQIVQQSIIIKYKYLLRFLNDHAPQAAQEILINYQDTLSKIYTGYFKTYVVNLTKLRVSRKIHKLDNTFYNSINYNPSFRLQKTTSNSLFCKGDCRNETRPGRN